MKTRSHHIGLNAVTVAVAIAAASTTCRADPFWSGSGATSNWTNASNWAAFDRPGTDGTDTVRFSGLRLRGTNTVNQDYSIKGLVFQDEFGDDQSWTLNQANNAVLELSSGVFSYTESAQTINVPLRCNTGITISNDDDGDGNFGQITVGSVDLNGATLNLSASSSGISVTGTISGAGDVVADGLGAVMLSGVNAWTGRLFIERGSVVANAGVNLGSVTNQIVFDQTDASSAPTLIRRGTGTISTELYLKSGEGRVETPAGVTVTLAAGLDGTARGGFAKTGAGTLVLAAECQGYGDTVVRAGTLRVGVSNALSSNGLQVLNGSTLEIASGTTQTVLTLNGYGDIQLAGSSTLSVGRTGANPPSDNGTGTFGGVISGVGVQLRKQGAGTFVLLGANAYSGTTSVHGGALVADNQSTGTSATGTSAVTVHSGARLAGDGSVAGPVDVQSNGQIAPSNAAAPDAGIGSLATGTLTLDPGARTLIEYDDAAIDRIIVTGTATLGGSLELTKLGPALPRPGVLRQLLFASAEVTGRFSSVSGVALSSSESIAVTYIARGVIARVAAPGDLDFDRWTDFDDLLILAANYNAAGVRVWTEGDVTGDGATNFDDLLIVAANYNRNWDGPGSAPLSAGPNWALAQVPVPEPTMACIAIVGAAAVLVRRTKR